ncbi:calmodulin [Angomonas deanei]|uniref:EF-hand domain-containing protein n=1 Tax=Angomonas deanei TaxID=59799 RepID=S9VF38_9TRYP|nr:calmodulin [Angomonas deanei]EPY41407.1 calmodulin [Angomonas deanei]CAD2220396.1 hypothetical protein, conserved [Angomonas deanei]|eukprot:EPY35177.1 calmodulin [Angomonas deanei]
MSFANNSSVRSSVGAVSGFSSPTYRGELNHGASAELQEGFRILTNGQKVTVVDSKQLQNCLHAANMQLPEEELLDLLRVVHQSDRPNQQDDFEFSDFMHLMTHEASDEMISEMKTAFLTYDKSKTGFVTKKQFTEMFISMGEKSNAEELEELLCVAENFVSPDDAEKIDYNKFMTDLVVRLNTM